MTNYYKSFTNSISVYKTEEKTAQESATAFFKTLLLSLVLFVAGIGSVWGQCNFRIQLKDSYGDGWNGGTISSLKVNGNTVLSNLTLTSSAGTSWTSSGNFTAYSGQSIQITYASGSYCGENLYRIQRDDSGTWNEVYTSGTCPTGTYTITSNGCTISAPACTGTPSPGNAIASVNPVGGGSSTILSLQNATTGSGVTYQWKSSIDNVTYTSISGETNATYTATPSAATYYVCDVTCSGVTTTSNPVQVTLIYCTPTSSSSSTYFSGFTTSGGSTNISNNSTAFSSGGYVNYSSSMAVSQFSTGTVNFSATIVGGTAGIAIFVDYNNDFDFTDVGETVYNSAAYQATGTTTASFIIPSGTPLGNYRMRIITDYNASSPTSCSFASGSRGEIEDYTLTVVAQPTCMAPTALATSSITNNSASLSWTASVTAPSSGYDVYYSTTNTAPTSGTTPTAIVASGTTYAYSGLTASTTYYSWVRSNCGSGDVSTWAASASFKTLCDPISSLPWTEGFEGLTSVSTTTFPSCWSEGTGTNWNSLSAATSSYNDPRTGNYYIGCYFGGTNDRIWTPGFQLTAGVSYDFSTYFVGDGYSSWTGDIVYNTSALASGEAVLGTSFITSSTVSTSAINYSQITRTFVPSTSGVYYFGIRITSPYTYYGYLAFDDFKLELTPTCIVPTSLSVSSITNSAANLSWTASASAPGSGYEVYYSTTNTAPLAGTTASASVASGTTYAFTGLTPNTTYYSWVRSNCGSGDLSTWAASASFTTLCDPISSFPYSENFDGVTTPALPNCWSVLNVNNDTDKWITYTGYSQSGNNSVGLYTDYNAGANNDFLISPQFNLSGIKRLKYSVRARSSSEPNDYRVLLSTTGSSASDFSTVLLPLTSVSSTSYTEVIIDLSMYSGNIFIAFNVPSGGLDGYYIYIDDVIIEDTPNTWTGTTSNSWNTSGNWSLGTVPTSSDNIVISSNTPNAPVMDIDVTIPAGKSLRINSSGTLTIAPGKVLTIAGTANFNGKAVTFKSDATGTAMLGTLTGTLNGATNVKVERFIPSGKRAFRLLSPAVTTTTFISGNWQGQTHITGGASGGFDVSETNNPSMFTYNNQVASGTGWTPIANTNATNLTAGVGYRMLVRGDRTPTNITAATTDNMNAAITLSTTGTLKTGTVTLDATSTPAINNTANTTTADYSLVGNPYQSAVDWNAVTKSGIDASYYAWDPNMGTSIQRGRYVVFNGTTNDNVSSQVGQFIQPGQAFFVKNTVSGTAGTLTFQEAHKASTNANVFRTNNQTESTNFATLSMQLYDPNELAIGGYPIDATKAVFGSEYTNQLGLGDATKLEAAGENIAWFRNNTKLAIDAAAPVTTSDELIMKTLRLGANKNYTFKIQTTNFDTTLTPYLVDNFLNTQTEISTSQAYLATFATTGNVASYNENRFKIVFQNAVLSNATFQNTLAIYPNPAKAGASFYVEGISEATVTVSNLLGQTVPVQTKSQGTTLQVTPNTSLSQGVYLVNITSEGNTQQVKWIVE